MKSVVSLVLLCLLFFPPAYAVDAYDFKNESDKQRYLMFVKEMRCPMCQNQNLDGSNSKISIDLRRELHRMISEGKSDADIIDFMTERYGEFILYKPRFNADTAVLWGLPFVLALLGAGVIALIVLRARRQQSPLSESELERAADLLEPGSAGSTPNTGKGGD